MGDSLSRSIDQGLALSRFGLTVITQHFLQKPWPEYELRGLVAREIEEDRVILPIWHGVTRRHVLQFSPPLADKVTLRTEGLSAQDVAIQVLREVRPDLYSTHPRSELERIASGAALRDLQEEMDRTQKELEETREELAEYRCPHCGASLSSRIHAPADPEENNWDVRETFECGYHVFSGYIEMNENLNAIVKANKANQDFEDHELFTLYDYFNLCGEEYLFYRRGYIYPEVWRSWVAGMKFYHDDKRIQRLWAKELSSQSYYGLDISKEIKQLSQKPEA